MGSLEYHIRGGNRLSGVLPVSGAKNSAIVVIPATILVGGKVTLDNVPNVGDVWTICEILEEMGASFSFLPGKNNLELDTSTLDQVEAPYHLVRKMRASFCTLGPLLARFKRAKVPLPGGCNLGVRAVDQHILGLEALGAKIEISHGKVIASADKLVGARFAFNQPRVTATENLMMAAALAEGGTLLDNCAEEPEVVDLADFLNACGAHIEGQGTKTIRIEGVRELHPVDYRIIPDRIEAGTFMIAVAAAKGDATLAGARLDHMAIVGDKLRGIGASVVQTDAGVRVAFDGAPRPTMIDTLPYPGFPTDLGPQMAALLSLAAGTSVIEENIFESRFSHVDELNRMGAKISVKGTSIIVEGVGRLTGAPVAAYDIRAGAALVVAGLAADNDTVIEGVEHIQRGYENLIPKLTAAGAMISEVVL